MIVASITLTPIAASAVELPPAGNNYWIQTNGPNAAVTLGDWYTSNVAGAGAGYHYVQFQVPCGWPAGLPVFVDLFSPEENRVAGALAQHEEPNGNYDSTQFELYGPGATVGPGFASPAPGAGIPGTRITYQPGAAGVAEAWTRFATLSAPVTCGSYVLRSEVLTVDPLNPGGTGDDQNGWRLRVGNDNDADPTNAPPANYDNPDGVTGTNDEIVIGMAQTSFQQNSGAVACQTFYEYTNPGQASATFNNFDMDGNTRLRYYAPGDPSYDPNANAGGILGTLSGNGVWNNGGTLAARLGDTIAAPTTGWWRIVNCISNGNQLIQEGQQGVLSYYTQPPTPSMTLTKTDGIANASPGQALTYNITATNNSAGATRGAANSVVVTDTIPAGFTYTGCSIPTPAQGSWVCSQAAGVVTFTQTGWINGGANAVLRVTGTVNQGVSGTITDTARVNYADGLGNPFAQVTATDVDNIVASSNLSITKTDSTDPENPGQSFFYTLRVNNAGPSNASNLVVSDTVPSQYTVTSVTSPTGSCGNVGNVVSCTLASMASGAPAWVITVNVTVKASTVGGTYVNTATVSATEADPAPANNTVNNNNTVRSTGDLALTKTDGVASVTVGSSTTYTITVTNNGPDIEPAGVVISDTIPAGTVGSETEADCAIVAGVFRCTTTAALAVGASQSYQLTLTLPAGYAAATVVNTATITTFPIVDTVAGNNSATDTDTVPQANLSITKTDSIDPVNPGQSFTYTLTVNNAGPSTATSLVVSDTVPSQYTVTSATSPTGACGNVGNVVTCTLASMVSGAPAWVITVNVTAKTTTPGGTYVNTATVSASTNDPTPANNTVNNNNTVRSYGDLLLTKTDGTATVTAGTSTIYTITITNNGPSTEPAGVRFTDTIPAGTVGSETEADCAIAAGVFTCTTAATIASGATKSYQLTLAVPSGYAPATVVNTANITVRPITDPDLTNNSATDTDNVTRSADLSITKTDSADPVNPGQAFTYTLTVTNNGPSDAATLTVSDTVPAQFTVTNVTSPAGACGHAGNVVTCTRPTFVNAATWVITVSVTANLAAPGGTYTDTATVSAATADPTPANNSASQDTTITASADLAVTKTDGVASVVAGTSTTYTITLTNNGPSAVAAGIVVSDPIPAGTVGSESEANCVIAAGTFTCTTTAVLISGTSVVYQLTLAVPSGYAPATVANTATITSSPSSDPNATNDSATDTDTVTGSADLSITKTDGVASVTAGTSTTYTITVTNNGPSNEPSGVVIADPIPAGTIGSESEPDCVIAAGTFTCTTTAPIASGGSLVYQLTLAVAASFAPANLSNTASITGAPATDPNAANDTATDTDSVARSADLSIAKTDSADPVIQGQAFTYTITVTNNGPSDSATVEVSDTVPAQFTVTNVTSPAGACSNVGNVVTCTRATFAAAGSWVITVSVTTDLAATPGVYTDTATVSAATADPVPGNDSGSQSTTIIPSADLSIVKTDSVDPIDPGLPLDYTIVVTNNGPSTATGLTVTDNVPAPAFISVTSVTSASGSCGNVGNAVTCTLASLASGATWTITVSVFLDPSTPGGLYTDTANVTSATNDPNPANNAGSQGTIVLPAADLALTKTDGAPSVTAGTSTTYTITLTNNGPSTVGAGVVVSDPIPAGTTGSESEPDCSIAAGTFTCTTTAALLPAGSVSYQLTLVVPASYALATLSNTASVTSSPVAEVDPSNDSATDTDAVVVQGDLGITKTDGVASVTAGTSTTYTITATNSGPSQVPAGVVLSDPIPAGTAGNESEPDCSIAAGTFTCTTSAPIAVGGSVSYQLTLDVAPGYAPPTLVNTASVTSSPAVDTNPANDSATDTDTVTTSADLALTKSDGVASVVAGTSTTYTITVTNNGPSSEPAGVVLSDLIPAGTSGSESEADCAIVAGTFTCTTSAAIAPGASLSYQLTLAVPPGSAMVSLTNTVSITSTPASDPDASNDTATDTDAVTRSADLSIAKSDGVGSVIAGTSTTYTIAVTNGGPSTEPAGVVIDDPIPAGTTPSESEPDCVIAAGTFTCTTTAALAPGASVSYQLTLALPSNSALVSLVNTASISSSPIPDPNGANDSATDTDAVTTSADLSIVKADSVDPIDPGLPFDYTITVTNNGPSDAVNLQVTDNIPAPASFQITGIVASAGVCGNVGNAVTCTLGALPVSGTWVITISILLDPATPGGLYTDTAVVTSATSDPVPANNSDSESTIVLPAADMLVTKTDGVASVTAGTSTTYTITLSNTGPSTEPAGVVVSDPIPAGTSGSESEPDCAIAAGTFTCTTTAPIAPGGSVSYQLTLNVPAGYAPPTLANTATITFTPIADTDPTDDSATDTDAVTTAADLAITKTDAPDPVVAGNDVTYTLTVSNAGPSDASGVLVTDTLPGSVTFVSATSSQGSCAQAAGVVTCPLGTIANGGTATITVVVTTTIDGLITDTAVVSASTPDPAPADNTASQSTTVTASADLAITKTDGVASISAGASTTYTITVTNNGPSIEPAGVVITDPIPAGTNGSESEADCSIVAGTFTCTTSAALASGASVSYQLTVAIPSSYVLPTVSNTATISGSPVPDPNAANDSATDVDAVGSSADLSITKTDAPDPVALGNDVTYTITVTNNGPSDAAGVVVTDTLPGFTTFVSAVASQGGCAELAGIVTCPLGAIVAGGVATIIVVATSTVVGVITNEASVTAATPDPALANNDVLEDTTVIASADLAITKTDGIATISAGTSTTYTITVTNIGPSDEPAGAVISDPIPVGTNGSESEADCSIAAAVFTCTTSAPLVVGAFVTYQLTLAIPPGYALPAVTNTASITSSSVPDPNAANDSATDVDALSSSADLSIVKTDAPDPVTVGGTLTYTLVVTNNGPADATGVTVTDTLPAGVTFGTATPTQGSCAQGAGIVTCPLGTVLTLATATITITVTPTVPGSISNTATVSATTLDPIPANNSDTEATVVGASADLAITKTDGVVTIKPGASTTYTITITNNGPSDVPAGIVVTDQVPVGTTGSETEPNCTLAGATFTCTTTATLVSGASIAYQLTVVVGAAYILPTLVNTAAITITPVPDPNLANNTATDTDTVTPLVVDLSIAKTDSADPVQPGDSFNYTILVTNAGPDAATGVVVTDPVPSTLTVIGVASSSPGVCIATSNLVTCSIDPLAVGAVWTITVTVTVPLDATSGTVTNTATVVGAGDTDPSNDSASETTTIGVVGGSADLVLTKTVDDASPHEGDTITYTVTVTNNGPDDATGVQVTDVLPGGVTYISDSPTQGSYDAASGVWDVGSLAFGESATLQIQAGVNSGTGGSTITNGASVSAEDQSDPNPGDNAATAPAAVAPAGGTALTGLPTGPAPFAWMFALALLGLAALGLGRVGRRRTVTSSGPDAGASGTPTQPARFLAEPFFFFKE
ncbi:MAG: DUF7507 domain-containing protein [Actinomycetota bacterium]